MHIPRARENLGPKANSTDYNRKTCTYGYLITGYVMNLQVSILIWNQIIRVCPSVTNVNPNFFQSNMYVFFLLIYIYSACVDCPHWVSFQRFGKIAKSYLPSSGVSFRRSLVFDCRRNPFISIEFYSLPLKIVVS